MVSSKNKIMALRGEVTIETGSNYNLTGNGYDDYVELSIFDVFHDDVEIYACNNKNKNT